MKRLSMLLVLALIVTMFTFTASGESTYKQSPMLDARVESGELPPVEERLPVEPKVINDFSPDVLEYEIGNYGGKLRTVTAAQDWDTQGFIGMTENILNMVNSNSQEITPNLVSAYTMNEDGSEYTFTLREGLKWSDGTPVTMEDFRFAIEDFVFNEELTPIVNNGFRTGGSSQGTLMTFTVLDDMTFSIKFDGPYGGFPVYISIKGWAGYTDLLKPAHFLKQFHIDYAEECHGSLDAYYEFIKPFAESLGYYDPTEESVWVYVFNAIDMTNWELTSSVAALTSKTYAGLIDTNFPVLYPYVMVSSEGGVMLWERNPYYQRVDAEGNQLPYIDYFESTYVEDPQLVQMKIISGDVDLERDRATIDNVALYKENEASGGFTAYIRPQHITPSDAIINITYGLNADGTLKDDEASQAWQEVVNLVDFRKAMAYAIDGAEIIDSVYYGFGEVNTTYSGATYDPDYANELLDGLGMLDVDGDGYRETPSGKQLAWFIFNANNTPDLVPVSELYVEFWREIGLNCTVQTIEGSLFDTMMAANEIPMSCFWLHEGQLWHYADYVLGRWAPLYEDWYKNGGLTGAEVAAGLEPDEQVKEFYRIYDTMFIENAETAVNEVVPQLLQMNAENYWVLIPITNVPQCLVVNSDIGNVPNENLNACCEAFGVEGFFYRTIE